MDPDPRFEPPPQGGELETLSGFLRWQRETFELKCSGLDAAGLARRSVEPSSMSLLGLLRHLADVERAWFRSFMSGQDATAPPRVALPSLRPRLRRAHGQPVHDHEGSLVCPD
ncbi:MAG: DUF664 domain-containing protein [Streptosporangiaceae bacterium]